MTTEFLNLFPIPIMKIENFLNMSQCEEIFKKYKDSKYFTADNDFYGNAKSTYSNTENLHEEISNTIDICRDFTYKLNDALDKYNNFTGFYKSRVENSWINVQHKGSKLLKHSHPASSVSGCIYLNCDELSHNICFENPNKFIEYSRKYTISCYTNNLYCVKPKIGDLILFPSWLIHSSNEEENQSDYRLVFAFNSWYC